MMRKVCYLTVVTLLLGVASWAQETSESTSATSQIQDLTMEDIVVTGVQTEIHNAFTLDDFHKVNSRGDYYYRTRQYKKAFPYLLASAKRGFKIAQSRVGHFYLTGLGDVKISVTTGLGWLGVAASPRSDPGIKNYYKDMMERVPEHLMGHVERIVEAFIAKYGPDATGMSCVHNRTAGTHVSTLACNFELEFDLREALYQDWLATGFGEANNPQGTGQDTSGYSTSPDSGGGLATPAPGPVQ